MIHDGFLTCPICRKKIMPITERDVVVATVYCGKCKAYYRVEITGGKLLFIRKEASS